LDAENAGVFAAHTMLASFLAIASQPVTNDRNDSRFTRQLGSCGGVASFPFDFDDPSKISLGSYSSFDNCAGLVLNGSFGVQGAYFRNRFVELDGVRLNLTFSDLRYTRSDGSVLHSSGTIQFTKEPSVLISLPANYIAIINVVLRDGNGRLVASLENFVFRTFDRARFGTERAAFSGRIGDPTLGFVGVVSPEPLRFPVEPAVVSASTGSFLIESANKEAEVSYVSSLQTIAVQSSPADANLLDATFGVNGKVTTLLRGGGDDQIASLGALVLQPDGKLVASGAAGSAFSLARYNSDGSLDTSFGTGGKVFTDTGSLSFGLGLVLQDDGKLVCATYASLAVGSGQPSLVLARYDSSGRLDTSFGGSSNGVVVTPVGGSYGNARLLRQPDGRLLVYGGLSSGSSDNFIAARYNEDGNLDADFGAGGIISVAIDSIAFASGARLQPDGKIVIGGSANGNTSRFVFLRFNADGSPDASFGSNGRVDAPAIGSFNELGDFIIQPDGKLLATGTVNNMVSFVRYDADGNLDAMFGTNGILTQAGARGHLMRLPDGRLLVGTSATFGPFDRFALRRFSAEGVLDEGFGKDGLILTEFFNSDASISSMIIQADGKIVAAGRAGADFALVRYLP
jgi:uncharacterized delta-60 repeat protein